MVMLEEALLSIAYKDVLNNQEYLDCVKRISQIEEKIIKSLGSSKLLLECENLICTANHIYIESIYKICSKREKLNSGRQTGSQ